MKTKTPNLKIIPDFLPNASDFFHLVMQKVQWDERCGRVKQRALESLMIIQE